jgi:hypothetical protein
MEMKFAIVEMGCQNGAVVRSMFEINIGAYLVGSIPGQTHSSCDREGDSLTA